MNITIWSSINEKTGKVSFNHIEDGWSMYDKPQPIKKEFTNQLAWGNMEWQRRYGLLVDGKVIKLRELFT